MRQNSEKPWYRKVKDCWYAWIDGRQVSLGIKGKSNRKAALDAFHRLMADGGKKEQPKAEALTIRQVCDAFLAEAPNRLKPNTIRIYGDEVERVCASFGKISADRLTTQQLAAWLVKLNLSGSSKSISIRAISAVFSWAVKADLLITNPAKDVPRPKSRSRSHEAVISQADHTSMLALASPQFRLVLTVLHATGCRPTEACHMSAENFNAEAGCVVLHEHKTDGTGKPRIIFLNTEVCELLKEQAKLFPTGALLRSNKGKAWTQRNITQAMRRLKRKAKVKAIAYGYRHSFATDALANGVPDATVAALLGHSSTTMLHKHYSHLTARADVLRKAASMVR